MRRCCYSSTSNESSTTVCLHLPESNAAFLSASTTTAGLEATCDWDSPRLTGNASGAPISGDGDVAEAMLGSWQHTYIDDGSGFVPLDSTRDIRYVLAAGRFLYCQDVEGATDQAENSAPFQVEGATIVLPSPAYGYEVVAWNDTTMVWHNLRDDTLCLLQRR